MARQIEGPVTAEQLARWENRAATGELPVRWKDFLSRKRLEVTLTGRVTGDLLSPQRSDAGSEVRRWTLAEGVAIGMRGRSRERIDPRRFRSRVPKKVPDAFVPRWAAQIFHPALSAPPPWFRGTVERRGIRGELHYGVYPPDDRQVHYPSGYPWQCIGKIYAWNDINASSPSWSGRVC
jgi:hypothetical protein